MKDCTAIEDALLLRGSCDFDPIPVRVESGLWYQYYFQIERGRKELTGERQRRPGDLDAQLPKLVF